MNDDILPDTIKIYGFKTHEDAMKFYKLFWDDLKLHYSCMPLLVLNPVTVIYDGTDEMREYIDKKWKEIYDEK